MNVLNYRSLTQGSTTAGCVILLLKCRDVRGYKNTAVSLSSEFHVESEIRQNGRSSDSIFSHSNGCSGHFPNIHVCILNLEIIERCYQLPPGVLTCNDTVSPQLTVTDIQLAAKSS